LTTNQPAPNPQAGTEPFATPPPAGGESAGTALPQMIGDLGITGTSLKLVTTTSAVAGNKTVTRTVALHVPITARGAIKISENESPLPQDRVFITYNYFADVSTPGISPFQVHRQTAGFEKAFLDGDASFGMRVPAVEQGGAFEMDQVGDVSFISKYAFYHDRETGNLISGGLSVSAPVGPGIDPGDATNTIRSVILQPYVGYVWRQDRFYLHGFSEILVPTDTRDVTFMCHDVGMGYRVADWFIPTVEVHANIALDHNGLDSTPIGFSDSVILTSGFHSQIGAGLLTLGVAVPVTGPRFYDVEAVVQFNYRF
jgi:hypothetical protein